MANVKFNEKTYYVPSEKFLVGVKQHCNVYKDPSTSSKKVAYWGRRACRWGIRRLL